MEKYGDMVLDAISNDMNSGSACDYIFIANEMSVLCEVEKITNADIVTYSHHFKIIDLSGESMSQGANANAKANANAAQGLPELIETASGVRFTLNTKPKHNKDAKHGWYRYESRFALPVFGDNGEVTRYNVFHVAMILRHAEDGKKYLYDIMNIKKETSSLFQP